MLFYHYFHEYLYTTGTENNIGREVRSESLPNVKGIASVRNNCGLIKRGSAQGIATGCFTTDGAQTFGNTHIGVTSDSSSSTLLFDASRTVGTGKGVYKDNGHVQPRSKAIGIWERTS